MDFLLLWILPPGSSFGFFGLVLGFALSSWVLPSWTRHDNLAPKKSQLNRPLKFRPVFAIGFPAHDERDWRGHEYGACH